MTQTVKFNVDEEEWERINERAEEAGLARAAYVRHRFRAGELLWTSGELNGDTLTKIAREKRIDILQSEDKKTRSQNNHPESPKRDLKEIILPEIPHRDSGDAISEEELKELIFGTEKEREDSITQAIEDLYGEKITRRADGLLVRYGEEDD